MPKKPFKAMGWEEALYYKGFIEAHFGLKPKGQEEKFSIETFCFDKQVDFIRAPERFKTLCKSRRAGGTVALAAWFIEIGMKTPNCDLGYVTLDRGVAERIFWPELIRINDRFSLGLKFNQQKLTVEFPENSYLYLASGKDRAQIDKLRGKPFRLVAIDEAQSMRDSILKELIDDILEASLIDYGGHLVMCGTPNAACSGYFYRACQHQQYKHFFWTMKENPWIAKKRGITVDEIHSQHLKEKGITEDDPTFQREWLGRWVRDDNALVYKFKEEANTYTDAPPHQWTYVIGVDLGFNDPDAVVVWGFSRDCPAIYQMEEHEQSGSDVTDTANFLKSLIDRLGHKSIYKIVVDAGGLGRKVHEELANRFNIPCFPAQKSEKINFISLMNSDFKAKKIFLKKGSKYAEQINILQWDAGSVGRLEDPGFQNDLCDAGLYGYRECLHFLHTPPEITKPKTALEIAQEFQKTAIEKALQNYGNKQKKEWWQSI